MRGQISVVILAGDHRRHIGPCLRTAPWADEIVVVDDGSTDGTLDIARSFPNVRILHRRLDGNWAAQMNFGIEQASGDWVLQLDVDERVPPELAAELQELAGRPGLNGVAVRILANFLGEVIGHQRTSRSTVRMVRKGCGKFEDRRVHAELQVQGNVVVANNPLVHLGPFPTAESFWVKNALYAQLEAKNNVAHGERMVSDSPWPVLFHCLLKPLGVFIRKYFLEGRGGWG